jgi:uncharacterized phage protein gp47/JayE
VNIIKTLDEIYEEMRTVFSAKTGTEATEGGDLAVRLYTVASQVFALYTQAEWVKRQCFPQTAEGEQLDLHAELRGLSRRQATAAEGVIRFSVEETSASDWTIPAGTVCMTSGLIRFETMADGVLQAGMQMVDIPAKAVEPRSSGNVAAGTICSLAAAPVGVSSCFNPTGFTGGTDAEGDEALRTRVLETFRRLPNGANAAFYEQGALSFDQVVAAAVIPRSHGKGTVDVVVTTAGGLPSADLLSQLTAYFEEKREIAVDVTVRAPAVTGVDVSVQIKAAEGMNQSAVLTAAEQALRSYFTGERLGQDILRARLGKLLFTVDGVDNYKILSPATDLAIAGDVLPQLDALTVEAMT